MNKTKTLMILATWFGCGLSPKAPGTVGTIGALPLGVLLLWLTGWQGLLCAAIIISIIGYFAAATYERETDTHDAGAIVIDEVAGMWIALLPAALSPVTIILAFGLFRLFDILKPFPVSWADRRPGAMGVMLDDILAGIMAAFCLWGGGLCRDWLKNSLKPCAVWD